MNALVYLLFSSAFLTQWVVALGIGPRALSWTPEIISGLMMPVVALRIAADRSVVIPRKYMVWFGIMAVLIAMGVVTNAVQSGAVFAGLRAYFRYAPAFLLPLVYYFSDKEITQQLKFVLFLGLLQLPVVIYQRLTIFKTAHSGDVIMGTVGGSGVLSIFLICAITMLTAFLVRKKIRLSYYIPLVLVLFFPTTINETSATLLLLPAAFILPAMLMPSERSKLRTLIPLTAVGALFLVAFTTIYNAQFADRWGGQEGNIINMLVKGEALTFLYKGATPDTRAEEGQDSMAAVGRLDAIIMPFKVVSDPVRWMLGNGIGNVSISFNETLQGDYVQEALLYGATYTAAGKLMWEIGVLGFGLSFLFLWFVFRDAQAVLVRDDIPGVVALGWAATVPILAATMFYINLVDITVLGYLMWYMSGYVISKRYQQYYEAQNVMGVTRNSRSKTSGSIFTPTTKPS